MKKKQLVIVFARYPESGKVKSRLIPAIGAEKAAHLQALLTKHIVSAIATKSEASQSVPCEGWDISVRFTGSSLDSMKQSIFALDDSLDHLPRISFTPQSSGDLGSRLADALQEEFRKGYERIVVIGTDSPDIDARVIARAFQCLERNDIVLGPALDGGYYLIGLKSFHLSLFEGIDWGTEHVLKQTLAEAKQARLSAHLLDALPDVDYVDDLIVCKRLKILVPELLHSPPVPRLLSIIIPVLNEAKNIERLLEHLQQITTSDDSLMTERIFVDGGSSDQTVELLQKRNERVIRAPKGRGRQLNAGSAVARGEVLLFLHADCRVPEDFQQQIWSAHRERKTWGAFHLEIDSPRRSLKWVQWGANLRSRWLRVPYGDQGLFVDAELFYAMGGFPPLTLMEDYVLVRRLRRKSPYAFLKGSVRASARRWEKLGVWRTTWTNQCCLLAYSLGVPVKRIAQWYRRGT